MRRRAAEVVVGLVTCSGVTEARKLATALLERRLVACVNLVDRAESHYWWQGRLERSLETLLVLKTTRGRAAAAVRAVRSLHSYDLPETVFWPVAAGNPGYLEWVRESVRSPRRKSQATNRRRVT